MPGSSPGMTSTFPRRDAPGLLPQNLRPETEGVGNAGCLPHPQPRVQSEKAHERSHRRSSRFTRHSRTRVVLTVSFVLSPAIGLVCHRHLADTSAKLDAGVEASGPHDFAVRVRAIRQKRTRVHRIPRPTSVTIAIRPSDGTGQGRYGGDLGVRSITPTAADWHDGQTTVLLPSPACKADHRPKN
jgi:hypothetical protein